MARSDDIASRLDSIAAAIAMQGELLVQIVARLDHGETAPATPQWTTPKSVARELGVSPDTVLRRGRAIGCVHEIGRLVLVDAAAVAADLLARPVRHGARRTRDEAHDVPTVAR
jgi:hypothetical protein